MSTYIQAYIQLRSMYYINVHQCITLARLRSHCNPQILLTFYINVSQHYMSMYVSVYIQHMSAY